MDETEERAIPVDDPDAPDGIPTLPEPTGPQHAEPPKDDEAPDPEETNP